MLRVIGVGDNVVDKYFHLKKMFPGGNALNFSVYARQAGATAAYIGIFGTDEAAEHIISVLNEIGVDISHCKQFEGENGFAGVNLVDGDRVFVGGNKGGIASKVDLVLSESDVEYISSFDIVHSSCYSFIEKELPKLKTTGVPVSYDFSNRTEDEYLRLVCPYVDYSFMSCSHLSVEETKKKLELALELGNRLSLATRGAEGAILFDGRDYMTYVPEKVKAVDTLGAGDSFITGFLLHLAANHFDHNSEVLGEALSLGGKAAAKTCMVMGAFGYGKDF